MRSLCILLLALAPLSDAQSVLGTYYIPSDPNDIVPDLSVTTDAGIGVMTIQTVPVPTTTSTTEPEPATTTQCWMLITAESSTTSVAVQPTLINGGSPPGIHCWLVYPWDGGIITLPIPPDTDSSTSHSGIALTVVLPIVLAVILLASASGITFVHFRNKKRRVAGGISGKRHAWVNRKGGWVDEEPGIARPEPAQVAHPLREYI